MKTEQALNQNPQRGQFETVYVNKKTVSCEGNNPALGHPRVFLKLKDNKAVCPYCSKTFLFQE
ncbi:Uncharacterized protein R83526S56_LOCUS1232 [Commensalibacter communis]|uniref:zinc-finger domain-containing protein n=1 Tax=Commensalibacter communis TaxID=2972786 RepID=UPI0022FF673C|nr:zinc-finger domain-containing protein [Commensalibacter communis]CAI3934300.1 Uncharacterized protein R83540S59_LOCUS737 [Commensalibacter communis]CAI3937450.1 Uncharacterized protein R79674_LOCUS950 [Commensalibacter communis]CAI3938659.1 Uncharacterized protein R79672_LOCUS943 [Commensalibacter communis]CAI3942626.1 Uncharacterized protein R83526S56_LOCUS1232 [Commensalibacter communis]CAI3943934.1 Uncharacterized protein LMG28296_LOCUS1311 [Commensalibacter communis]